VQRRINLQPGGHREIKYIFSILCGIAAFALILSSCTEKCECPTGTGASQEFTMDKAAEYVVDSIIPAEVPEGGRYICLRLDDILTRRKYNRGRRSHHTSRRKGILQLPDRAPGRLILLLPRLSPGSLLRASRKVHSHLKKQQESESDRCKMVATRKRGGPRTDTC